MKQLLILTASCAVLLSTPRLLRAASLTTTDPAFTATRLFDSSPDSFITGVASDGRDVFYLENEARFSGGTRPTQLLARRLAVPFIGPERLLHEFGTFLAGNFLTYADGRVFGGEFTTGGIFAVNASTGAFDALGTVPANYDGRVFGGVLFLSHGTNSGSAITKFDLVADPAGGGQKLGVGELVLEVGESSGPLEFTGAGDLLYASSGGGVYKFTAAEVAIAATGPDDLALDAQHLAIADEHFSYLAAENEDPAWGTTFDQLKRVRPQTGSTAVIAESAPDTAGHLDFVGETLYANVTDFTAGNRHSSIYSIVPEPSSSVFLMFAVSTAFAARRPRAAVRDRKTP